MMTYVPISLTLLAVVVTFFASIAKNERRCPHVLAVIVSFLLAATAVFTAITGGIAKGGLGELPQTTIDILSAHQSLGRNVWWIALIAAVLSMIAVLKAGKVRRLAAVLAFVCALVLSFQVINTAQHGGSLVFRFGAGTPNPVTADQLVSPEDDPDNTPEEAEDAITDPRIVHYLEYIKPVIVDSCLGCHGPGGDGGLDLTSAASILAGGASGSAIVPGLPDSSSMYQLLIVKSNRRMPYQLDKLDRSTIEQFRLWIEQGAVTDGK